MPNPAFVHLRLHSEFSITDGIVRIDEAVARAAADGMPALAITDLANVFGMIKFYKAARAAGVKPIIGCDVWITNESERDNPHPVQFLKPGDFIAHEARVCIAEGHVLGDQRRPRQFTQESYFLSQAEMAKLFSDLPEALANSVEIARRCNLALELGKNRLPKFPTPDGATLEDTLAQTARQGLERRLAALYSHPARPTKEEPHYP